MNQQLIEEAQSTISGQREQLQQIVEKARGGDFRAAWERLKRWKQRTTSLIAHSVNENEAQKFEKKQIGSFIMGDPKRNLFEEAHMYDAFLQTLVEEIGEHPNEVFNIDVAARSEARAIVSPALGLSNEIFIVHGHDELNLLRLKEMLRDRWGLEPIVLFGEPGKGRTIIEKFEEEAQRAVFALALFTPDDMVSVNDQEYAQARPNVIFELGWFYGRLGRERVCILFKKGTLIHSDLNGISRIEFTDSVEEKRDEIERELNAAAVLKR